MVNIAVTPVTSQATADPVRFASAQSPRCARNGAQHRSRLRMVHGQDAPETRSAHLSRPSFQAGISFQYPSNKTGRARVDADVTVILPQPALTTAEAHQLRIVAFSAPETDSVEETK